MGYSFHTRSQTAPTPTRDPGNAAPPIRHRPRNGGAGNLAVQQLFERDPGQRLPGDLHDYLSERFGSRLDRVRIHDSAGAAASAGALQAKAYAFGNHIVFGQGGYRPREMSGVRLLAHEVAHVLQQTGEGRPESERFVGDETAADRAAVALNRPQRLAAGSVSPVGVARQTGTPTAPVLTPEEMFRLIQTERSWSFNPGGGALCEDPRGVGRGVGPAAGGRRAGHAVFAVIQVTDRQGQAVALTYGEHLSYGAPHAEQGAIGALNRTVPPGVDLKGGRMTVVLDQVPCPPGRQNCLGLLQGYAARKGLELDIRLPVRERMRGAGSVSPRTAAMSAQRTDVPAVSLRRYLPPGAAGPVTPGSTPAAPAVATAAAAEATPALKMTQPRPATPAMVKQRVALVSQLQRQTQRSIAFSNRIQIYSGVFNGLMTILTLASVTSDALSMLADGTVLPGAQKQADKIDGQAHAAYQWVLDTGAEINLLGYIATVHDAIEREDDETLFDMDEATSDLGMKLGDHARTFGEMARQLKARSQAAGVMSKFYWDLAQVPQGPSTAPNAQAFAMYRSLELLSGSLKSAADNYQKAADLLSAYDTWLNDLAYRANREAWSIIGRRIMTALSEMEKREAAKRARGEQVDRYLQRQRLLHRIAAIEEVAASPECLDPEVLESMRLQRDALLQELRLLDSGVYTPAAGEALSTP